MIKALTNKILRRFGYTISRAQVLSTSTLSPSTADAFHEQRRLVGSSPSPVIFDIGAHTGDTSLFYRRLLPSSRIYAFEPFHDSYVKLQGKVGALHGIQTFNIAIGDRTGKASLYVNRSSATNSLYPTAEGASALWGNGVLETIGNTSIEVSTVDDFMNQHREITNIDILKMDVQGSEYDVLTGAIHTMQSNRVRIIYMELIVQSTYLGQRELDEILLLIRSLGYSLHNFYNYCYSKDGILNQMDAIFIRNRKW